MRRDRTAIPETHICDLPDGCPAEIFRHIGTAASLPLSERLGVQHPLQCTLVCAHWRSVAESVISALPTLSFHGPALSRKIAERVTRRFPQLSELKRASFLGLEQPGKAFVHLAELTPQLSALELFPGFSCSADNLTLGLQRWTNLRTLDLSAWPGNFTAGMLNTLLSLTSIHDLSLPRVDEQDLETVCDVVGSSVGIETLRLQCSKPPPPSGRLPSILHTLKLSQARPFSSLDSLARFTELKVLHVKLKCSRTRIPESLGLHSLLRLTKLSIASQGLKLLPDNIGSLISLRALHVSYTRIEKWPTSLTQLKALESLYLCHCSSVPRSLRGLTSLERVSMEGYRSLPEGMADLAHLSELCLSNVLAQMPYDDPTFSLGRCQLSPRRLTQILPVQASLADLTALKRLEITSCGGAFVRPDEFLRRMTSLESVTIVSLPNLSALPNSMGDWCALTTLMISGCVSLRALPHDVGQLSALRELHVEGCMVLECLPDTVGLLGKLESLRVRKCPRVLDMPDTIGMLTGLRRLDLRQCGGSILGLRERILHLTSLEMFKIN